MPNDLNDMVGALQKGFDENESDSPHLSIDPKSSAVSVVGDPNKIDHKPEDYKLTFIYPDELVSDQDREKMTKTEDGEWQYTVTYPGLRVMPLHRTNIAMTVARIMGALGALTIDGGYNSEQIGIAGAKAFLDNIQEVAKAAVTICSVPEDQLGYIQPDCLVDFFVTLMNNEPNIIKEAAGFIPASLRQQLAAKMALLQETIQKTDTPQS